MGGIGRFLARLFRPAPITAPPDLQRFMAARAAFIAQKCVIEYCRARAGLNWQRLFSESIFQQAVHGASWQAWRLTLLDVVEMTDAMLRPHAANKAALLDGLHLLGKRIIAQETARQPLPAVLPATFVTDTHEHLRQLTESLKTRKPLAVKDIARRRAREVFAAIPIHAELKAPDEDYVFNTLRVYLVRAAEDLRKAADLPALAGMVESLQE